jgi:hypothetical protein
MAAVLAAVPADPRLAILQVEGGGVPSQQRDPLTLELCDVAQLLADQRGVVQVMLLDQQPIETLAFIGADQAQRDPVEQGLLGGRQERFSVSGHAGKKNSAGWKSSQFANPQPSQHLIAIANPP